MTCASCESKDSEISFLRGMVHKLTEIKTQPPSGELKRSYHVAPDGEIEWFNGEEKTEQIDGEVRV